MGNKPPESAASTRERILEAALTLFSSKGYLGASTREIAKAARVAEVTLFRHFLSKEQLLEEVIGRFTFLPALRELLPKVAELPYEEGLTILANRLLDTLIQRKDWIRVLHGEVQRSPDKLHRIFHAFIGELFSCFALYFAEMQRRGKLRDFDPELAARAFHGMIFSYFNIEEVLLRKNYITSDREQVIREFVRIFVAGTAKPSAAVQK